jgi:hypothetical protein
MDVRDSLLLTDLHRLNRIAFRIPPAPARAHDVPPRPQCAAATRLPIIFTPEDLRLTSLT